FLNIYKLKTSKLFMAAVVMGGICGFYDGQEADFAKKERAKIVEKLESYAENFGYAFQLKDDLDDKSPKGFSKKFGLKKAYELYDFYKKTSADTAEECRFLFLKELSLSL
ncbi:MAG: polyprenyl synthetase family protein, partial [Firmicutes bacterium]|nr:polyprenyl synthetase family protein [Bacillota bacterium]